ncbi:Predicted kinase, aminoglycoside phosphotransferase (APT) family [Cryobacterium flavum]|uniref:Predicted kinase, aminoglycoside phosphotransferase (APT) family n=2 Tax=Cryobacterium flavum TaxID=1424659 RepID=A0A5E9G3Z3_9MICO|nr:phosphotransferase [Cryobacterium flavum]SDO64802.1 Predicted kinase, aminoglycoside phosphotransferase (APT) family [Cryobacterium flavum]
MAMHDDELHIDEQVARRLILDQFPEWRLEPVRRIVTDGTVNAIFRIGADLTARFPLRCAAPADMTSELNREASAMRELATCCPVPTPVPMVVGNPGYGFPLPWSVQTWLHGAVATPKGLAHSNMFAHDLTGLVHSLRAAATKGRHFAGSGRGGDLKDSDEWMELCFRESDGLLPVARLRILWMEFRSLPPSGREVMTHGDLTPSNLLVEGDRLVGVLDGGGFAPADPSLDLVAAWHLLDDERRALVRSELPCDDLEWWRGAAWAFQQAMGLVWYYRESNPGMSTLGQTTLARIVNDPEFSAPTSGSPGAR